MTIDSTTSSPYSRRLLTIASEHGVQVHALPGEMFPGLDWDGLYLVDQDMGAGIAIRADLPPDWWAWVLAHELGHHFARLNPLLFSPFSVPNGAAAHKFNVVSRKRWGRWRRLHPIEDSANQWAARTLIDERKWNEAETVTPTNLTQIAAAVDLPLPAGLAWERIRRKVSRGRARVSISLDDAAWSSIQRATTGHGGHQALFRRITNQRVAKHVVVSFRDFSLARERLLTVGGGWQRPYNALLNAITPAMRTLEA